MATQIQFESHQLSDLAAVRDLGDQAIRSVVEHLARIEQPPLRSAQLLRTIASAIPESKASADPLVRVALSFNGLARQTRLSLDEVLATVKGSLDRQWAPEDVGKWAAIESPLRALLESKAVRLVANVIDLSYEYANLYRRGRILTDIRPLFDDRGETVEAAVISYTLRLRYDSAGDDHELSIAMDDADVKELAAQCERALRKAASAAVFMKDRAGVRAVKPGDRDDD